MKKRMLILIIILTILAVSVLLLLYIFMQSRGEEEVNYQCPDEWIEWINCMPIVSPEKEKYCGGPYHEWIKENCPNVSFAY